jgi:hypothetical protein
MIPDTFFGWVLLCLAAVVVSFFWGIGARIEKRFFG